MSWWRAPRADARAREGARPSAERLADLSRAVAAGRYEVDPRRVAEAMIRSRGRSARRG